MCNSFFEESFGAYKDIDFLRKEDGYYMASALLIACLNQLLLLVYKSLEL